MIDSSRPRPLACDCLDATPRRPRNCCCCVDGCPQWRTFTNQHTINGVLYSQYNTVRACQDFCVRTTSCVAVDFDLGSSSCYLHTSVAPGNTYQMANVNQYRIDRVCSSTTTSPGYQSFALFALLVVHKKRNTHLQRGCRFERDTVMLITAHDIWFNKQFRQESLWIQLNCKNYRSDVSAVSDSDVDDQQMLITVSTNFQNFVDVPFFSTCGIDIQSMNFFLCLPLARLHSIIPVSATASKWFFLITWPINRICLLTITFMRFLDVLALWNTWSSVILSVHATRNAP